MAASYPLLLDVTNRKIVIFGGGNVGSRKARGLLAAGATTVDVVSPKFCETIPAEFRRIPMAYQSNHLDGADLVFAATDSPTVNAGIVRDAKNRGVWVCRADESGDGDFITPAVHRDGQLTISVSAGSAALSANIRDEIVSSLDPILPSLANAVAAIRAELLESFGDEKLNAVVRRDTLRALASKEARDVLITGDANSLRDWLISLFPQLRQRLNANRC